MKKFKFTLLAASAVCAVAASALAATTVAAADDYRNVTLTGTNVFYAGVGGASIGVSRVEDQTEDGHTDYASFLIGADETITFRKNLAYSWWAADEDGKGVHNTFSMRIGFANADFESYTVKFQSQQYMLTEDEVSTNCLVFKPEGEGMAVYLSQDEEIDEEQEPSFVISDYSSFEISFGEYGKNANGNYPVLIDGENEIGDFVNVRGNYASYVSSGDSAATPLTFSATFGEDAGEDAESELIMYSLNGQSFEIFGAETDEDGGLFGGTIHDDCPPVVCVDGELDYLTYGEKIDIDYTVIDVVTSSPNSTVQYYVLTNEQFNSADMNYNDTSDEADLFTEVKTSSNYILLRDRYTYVPDLDSENGIVEMNGAKTYGLAKVCLFIRDTTSSRAQSDYVFMDWYVPEEYRVDISSLKDGAQSSADSTFIRIAEDVQGVSYSKTGLVDFSDYPDDGDDADVVAQVTAADFAVDSPENYKKYVAAVQAYYQHKIDEYIAENYPDGLYASSEANLYFPDFAGYVADNLGGFKGLSYRIYYSAGSQSSTSALDYNKLAMTVSEADKVYRFTIYVTDAAGNDMRYISGLDESNMPVYSELSADDIWEDENSDLLPFFEVSVSYKAATVEKPEVQSVGYVGSTYNNASFDITGVSGTYSTAYSLYIFDRDALHSDAGVDLSYEDVIANIEDLFFNRYQGIDNTRQYFTLVTDDERFESYEWNSENVTFVPQDASEYYVVRLTLKDTGLSNAVSDNFLVVRASARAAEIYGEDNWVQNNIAAIVLFCVAGVCFIAFVVLLLVKPKDKGDIDVIAAEAQKKSASSKRGS